MPASAALHPGSYGPDAGADHHPAGPAGGRRGSAGAGGGSRTARNIIPQRRRQRALASAGALRRVPAPDEDMGDTVAATVPNRRSFLGMAAVAAGTALLAGCEDPKPSDAGFAGKSAQATPYPSLAPVTALNTVLAVEHQAIFTYSAVAPLLNPAVAAQAASFRSDHEAHRDALSARIQALGGTPDAAKPAYDISPAPTDQPTALAALAALEDTAGKTGYRMVAGTDDTPLRTFLMTIMAAEGQHSSILLVEDGQPPIGPPFQSG